MSEWELGVEGAEDQSFWKERKHAKTKRCDARPEFWSTILCKYVKDSSRLFCEVWTRISFKVFPTMIHGEKFIFIMAQQFIHAHTHKMATEHKTKLAL